MEDTMETLREGSRAIPVKLLQRLLNKKGANPRLSEDGIFGTKTRSAVVAFQARERISQDGIVGSATWSRLGITIDITHSVRLFPQPTNMTCWSAAATMIIGNMSVGPGAASLSASGGLLPSPENVRVFAQGLGWRMYYPQTWTVGGLAGLLRQRPVWAVGGGTSPTGNWLHAIVLSALWSDGAGDGSGTMIRIHDPWPPNVGSIYGRFYRGTVDGFDFISLYILQPQF
jgi:hypothetical protein